MNAQREVVYKRRRHALWRAIETDIANILWHLLWIDCRPKQGSK
jgi:hypothetical protein